VREDAAPAVEPDGSVRPGTRPGDRLLLVKGNGGLAARMFAVVSAIVYARLTGRRHVVDWSDDVYSDDGSNVFPLLFSCAVQPAIGPPRPGGSVNPPVWTNRLDRSIDDVFALYPELSRSEFRRISTVDMSQADHPEDVLVHWVYRTPLAIVSQHAHGPDAHLRRLGWRALVGSVLAEDLRPSPEVQQRIDALVAERIGPGTIGVHVRYSDKRSLLGAVERRLDALTRKQADVNLFVATDNSEIERRLLARYPGAASAPRWYPPPGERMHRSPASPSRFENGVEALVDLYALGRCPVVVLDTDSGFARLAAVIARQAGGRVYDVRPRSLRFGDAVGERLPLRFRDAARPLLVRAGLRELTAERRAGRRGPSR
jgi:Nodulation protein Z (NodZ)